MILRATEDFKNSILGAFFGEMGIYQKSYLSYFVVLYFMQNFKFQLEHQSLTTHLGSDFGRLIKKLFNSVLSAFCVSTQNVEFVTFMVSEKHCLDMTDRRTHRHTNGLTWLNRFFSSRWSRIYIHVYTYFDYFANFTFLPYWK